MKLLLIPMALAVWGLFLGLGPQQASLRDPYSLTDLANLPSYNCGSPWSPKELTPADLPSGRLVEGYGQIDDLRRACSAELTGPRVWSFILIGLGVGAPLIGLGLLFASGTRAHVDDNIRRRRSGP